MRCTDRSKLTTPTGRRVASLALLSTLAAVLAGCASRPLPPPPPPPAPAPIAVAPAPAPVPVPPPVAAPVAPPALPLVASWEQYRLRAARMIMAANQDRTFSGKLPEPMQAIPVIQIQLNADGTLKLVDVMRVPRFAPEAAPMAVEAIRRAAPNGFGPVTNLPHPWQFTETFLYNDDLKFQLRTLVEGR